MPAPGKAHLLEVYSCTNDRRCLGCFDAQEPAAAPDDSLTAAPSPSATPTPAPAARPTAPTPAEVSADTAPPPVLLNARWCRAEAETDRCTVGEVLRLVARAHGLTASTATFTVRHGPSGATEDVTGTFDGEVVTARWTAAESGAYRFDVEADGARATSPELLVESDHPPLADIDMPIEVSVYVADAGPDGALLVLDSEGNDVSEKDADAATSERGGLLTFLLLPADLPSPVLLIWRQGTDEMHVAGPCDPTALRDALDADDLTTAQVLVGRAAQKATSDDDDPPAQSSDVDATVDAGRRQYASHPVHQPLASA